MAHNGLGIDADDQSRIFISFVRVGRRKAVGCGLGPAVCKKIKEEWGGTIWVESKLGAGSAFCFTILAGKGIAPAAVSS